MSASFSRSPSTRLGDALLDRGEERALLDHLARDVERQVGGIDQPAHEAQIARQDFGVVGDEDALDVELDAALAVGIEQVERPRAGHESERGVLLPALGAEMDGQRRLVELPGNAAVEIGVFRGLDLGLRLGPQRRAVGDLRRLGARLLDDRDRHRHVAGLRLDHALDGVALGVGLGVVHQMQHDAGAARAARRRASAGRDRERALAVGRPAPGLVAAGAARDHVDAVGDHEGRIEADAELADERLAPRRSLRRLEPLQKGLGAGARDGAERLDHLVAAHADAVVLDGEAAACRRRARW